jgi:hypothetical protein
MLKHKLFRIVQKISVLFKQFAFLLKNFIVELFINLKNITILSLMIYQFRAIGKIQKNKNIDYEKPDISCIGVALCSVCK